MTNFYQNADRNKQLSFFIVLGFILFVTVVVYVFSQVMGYGWDLVWIFFPLSILTSISGYWWSDKVVLTISGARPADRQHDFQFYTVAENLALAAQIPMPKLYVIDDTAMNAFSTGRDPQHAAVVATTGLLQKLDRTELEGVVAHELAHVRNYDTLLMSVVSVLVGLLALLGDVFLRTSWGGSRKKGESLQAILMVAGILLAILSPIIAQLIQLAISRRREFFADATGAEITKYPAGLASALAKLSQDDQPLEAANKATAHMYIVNPLRNQKGVGSWFAGLFDTHPPIADRIRALNGED